MTAAMSYRWKGNSILLFPHEGNFVTEADARADALEGDPFREAGGAECCREREGKAQMQEV